MNILDDYREWADEHLQQHVGTHSDRCHLWHDWCMIHRLAAALTATRDELASATRHMEMAEAAWLRETAGNSPAAVVLTDEEREAVAYAEDRMDGGPVKATLRGLLERIGGGACGE